PREYDANYDHQPTAQTWRPFLSAFYDAQAAEVVDAHVAFASDNPPISTADADGYFTVSAPVSGGFNGSIQLMAALPSADGSVTYFARGRGGRSARQAGGRVTA